MNITYVYADSANEWNSSEWRCAVPARAINAAGRHKAFLVSIRDFANNSDAAKCACGVSDIIVVQRSFFVAPVSSRIRQWQTAGKTVIGDFDDAFNYMPKSNAGYKYWIQGKYSQRDKNGKTQWIKIRPHPLDQFREGLSILDAVTVSSELLVKDWEKFTQSIHYLPNYIQLNRYSGEFPEVHGEIIIGWGGSATHLESFQGSKIMPALQRICREYSNVRIMICANDPALLDSFPFPAAQLLHQPFVAVDEWPDVLSRFDIGLAPLHGRYDDRRSWIKVLEYLVMGIPWIASNAPPYAMFGDYGLLVENTAESWLGALRELVENIGKYRERARGEAYQYGAAQDINLNVSSIINLYQRCCNKVIA